MGADDQHSELARRRVIAIDRYARTMHNRGLKSEADYLALTDEMVSDGAVDAFDSRDLSVTWPEVEQRLNELS